MHGLGPNGIHVCFGTKFRAKGCNPSGPRKRLGHPPPERVQTIPKAARVLSCLSLPMENVLPCYQLC